MTLKDRERLRYLANEKMEWANCQKNKERVELWKRHNACKGEIPVIHIEVGTFANDVIIPLMECEDEFARSLEYQLLQSFVNLKYFDDDKVVPPSFHLQYDAWFNLFGHKIKEEVIRNDKGVELGHHFEHIISDLEGDFDKVTSKSIYGVDKQSTFKKKEEIEEIFGDILPVELVCGCLYAVPTQKIVHLMGMENMLFSMYDYPDLFKEMMERIANSYIEYFKYLEKENVLLQNHSFEGLGQGSLSFWDEEEKTGQIKTTDIWGFMDSQETVGISPEMFSEFIFPYYKKIAQNFGRLSYGCCEPVNTFWNDIKTLPNLKKVSISPWCDEEFMGNELRGSKIIYHRKPNPNFLGVGSSLDEEEIKKHINKTLFAAKGCHLEITQRDVYTINRDIGKVKRFVEIIRECIDKNWGKFNEH